MGAPLVLKLGGELLESPDRLPALAHGLLTLARQPLVVVHGGGREIDRALARAGLAPRQIDGVRVTDDPALDIVVSTLAGLVNTRLVAALTAAGGAAVGLTGADAMLVPVVPAPPHRTADDRTVDLQRVGVPAGAGRPILIADLLALGYIPVVASIGIASDGHLFNVNADTMAAHLAARLGASTLIVAGGTAGLLDARGRTVPSLGDDEVEGIVAAGRATAGMAAKLRACAEAVRAGVPEVLIADGRDPDRLVRLATGACRDGSTVVCARAEAGVRKLPC